MWLATRNVFASACETVDSLHLLGAIDRQSAKMFLGDVLRGAMRGAVVGAPAVAGMVWLLGLQFAALDSGLAAGGGLLLADWLAIAAVPLPGVTLALVTARITIALALNDML